MTTTGAARGPEPLRLPLTKFLVFAWVIAFLAALWLSGHYVAVIVIVATAAALVVAVIRLAMAGEGESS